MFERINSEFFVQFLIEIIVSVWQSPANSKFIVFMSARAWSVSCYRGTFCDGPRQHAAGIAAAFHNGLLIHCIPESAPLHVQHCHWQLLETRLFMPPAYSRLCPPTSPDQPREIHLEVPSFVMSLTLLWRNLPSSCPWMNQEQHWFAWNDPDLGLLRAAWHSPSVSWLTN